MRKKGFTLIELLAVIVILAIIALVAVPLILNVIEDAKRGAARESATNYVKQVESVLVKSLMDGSSILTTGIYTLDGNGNIKSPIVLEVPMKGNKAKDGSVCIGEKGAVTSYSLKVGNYYVTSNDGTTQEITDEKVDLDCKAGEIIDTGAVTPDVEELLSNSETYTYMGGTYLKGEQTNNYVWYNGFMWRIMGMNSDGTIRLITDESVTSLSYGKKDDTTSYAEQEGYIHDWLNEYFYEHLNDTKSIIVEGAYFCSESSNSTSDGDIKREVCTSGNEVTAKVGILSVDEYNLARSDEDTALNYLNGGMYSWTMTPYDNGAIAIYYLNGSGVSRKNKDEGMGVRPVINIQSSSVFTEGDGTAQNFYVLAENKTSDITGIINEKVTSGEYVSLEGKTYRVVSKENDGVKLILDGYYENTPGNVYRMTYGSNSTFTVSSGVGKTLNENVLTWLGLSDSDKIVTSTFYQGDGFGYSTFGINATYQDMLKQSNGVEAKVGLIQAGDILASQSGTILTKNYTVASLSTNAFDYWMMNKGDNQTNGITLHTHGQLVYGGVANRRYLRPVIVVRSDLEITGGTGTWKNPYQI